MYLTGTPRERTVVRCFVRVGWDVSSVERDAGKGGWAKWAMVQASDLLWWGLLLLPGTLIRKKINRDYGGTDNVEGFSCSSSSSSSENCGSSSE